MDIYFNYCPDSHTGESVSLVKCTRDTFESGFMKAVELNVSKCMSSLGKYGTLQNVKDDLMESLDYYWGLVDNLSDDEFIEAVNNIIDETPELFDIIDFVVSDEPGDKTDEMVEVMQLIVIRKAHTMLEFILNHADDIIGIIRECLEKVFKEHRGYNIKSPDGLILLKVGSAVYDKYPEIVQFKVLTNDDYKYIGRECMNTLVQVLDGVTEEELRECNIQNEIIYKN